MGCTSSAPSTLSASASKEDKNIQFEEESEETYSKDVEAIDTESKNRTEIKELPPSDTTEPMQFVRNNKSTTSLEPEKDLNVSGHIKENESSDTSKITKEYEDDQEDENISKLKLEVVGKFIGTAQNTNCDEELEHPSTIETVEFMENEEAETKTGNETNLNSEENEHASEEAEEASPTQSQSSLATRWEALADIAAELPPSLAVDPITGQIYSLSK